MRNSFGNNITVTLFGESHGPEIGIILDGIKPGTPINEDFIKSQLDKRRPAGKISTGRQESDPYRIVSGVFEGKATGTAIAIIIPNTSQHSKDYSATRALARPGHADYTAYCKYHGYEDYRGGGHFSGRITAPIVAAGAIALDILKTKGIQIGTHIKRCAKVNDIDFSDYPTQIDKLNSMNFAVLDDECGKKMYANIEEAASNGDSVGGILETAVIGMPTGIGEPWFDSIESVISHALFSVPAIKGVEFGKGFGIVDDFGSEANDSFYTDGANIKTRTNNNGGINGGISNGMPIIIRTAVKPTPSIYKEQDTVNFFKNEDAKLIINGRHDPAIIHRARVVVDSMVALAILDLIESKL